MPNRKITSLFCVVYATCLGIKPNKSTEAVFDAKWLRMLSQQQKSVECAQQPQAE